MVVRDGSSMSALVEFLTGKPTAGIDWKLFAPGGVLLTAGNMPVPADAVSVFLKVDGGFNALVPGMMSSYRDLEYEYDVGGRIVAGQVRYTIEARVPFGVSPDGVRRKLGIDDPSDLPDSDIGLVVAYQSFARLVGASVLADATDDNTQVRDAIEARAALALLPTMSVRIAQKEDSGTSSFQRQVIDWEGIGASLQALVVEGVESLNIEYNPTTGFGAIFLLAGPQTDAFTGQ